MAYFTITSTTLTMTICRALFTKYAKSIGILLSMFSFFVHSATDNQIEQIKLAAEQHILATVEQPAGGELTVNAADIDSRIKQQTALNHSIHQLLPPAAPAAISMCW